MDLQFAVFIRNTGVAPFYYPLSLQLIDPNDRLWSLADDLHTLQPGDDRRLELTIRAVPVEQLNESRWIRLQSPILLGNQVIRLADRDRRAG